MFLSSLFERHNGVRGVHWDTANDSETVLTKIAQCASLLAVMRTPIEEGDVPPQPESPHRANAVLYNLARGHALVSRRTALSDEDLPVISRVMLSSMPVRRRKVFVALAKKAGQALTAKEVQLAMGKTQHTAEGVMRDLHSLGVMKFKEHGQGKASTLTFSPEWAWCLSPDFTSLLVED
jgi:hypothetical protein